MKEILGEDRVDRVVLFNNKDDRTYEMEINSVVINIGFSPNLHS